MSPGTELDKCIGDLRRRVTEDILHDPGMLLQISPVLMDILHFDGAVPVDVAYMLKGRSFYRCCPGKACRVPTQCLSIFQARAAGLEQSKTSKQSAGCGVTAYFELEG